MRIWSHYLVGVVAVAGLLGLATTLHAETCSLELKKVGATVSSPADIIGRSSYPQSFMLPITEGMNFGGQNDLPKFADVIDKDRDEYNAEHPARGVIKLGSQHFGYVLDSSVGATDEEEGTTEKETGEKEAGSLLSALSSALLGSTRATTRQGQFQAVPYDRLYFDRNHDGDLTDEEVIKAKSSNNYSSNYFQTSFDAIDVTLDLDSTTLDYAFTLSIMSQGSGSQGYVSGSVNAVAYRQGEITLGGKKHGVFLIDYNSNGRFDDEPEINSSVRMSNGQLYMTQGDRLYIDPDLKNTSRNPYGLATDVDLYEVSKLVQLDGRFYELTISPAGDKLSLEPSDVAVGYVSNLNKGFCAVVYGEEGFLKVRGDESGKAPLPAGQWKLQGYVINQTGMEQPEKAEAEESRSVIGLLTDALGSSMVARASRSTTVAATATADYKAVEVIEGQTVEMPFGPPYRPVVDVQYGQGTSQVSLGMTLVGAADEICTNMTINGARPGTPKFTIATADGQTVDEGEFEYG